MGSGWILTARQWPESSAWASPPVEGPSLHGPPSNPPQPLPSSWQHCSCWQVGSTWGQRSGVKGAEGRCAQQGSKVLTACWRNWRAAGTFQGSWGQGGSDRRRPGQGEKDTLTAGVPFFLNRSKQEAAAGSGSLKESHTLERSRELGNGLLRNKKEIELPRNYLWLVCFLTKKARCSGDHSERKIWKKRTAQVPQSKSWLQIPAWPFPAVGHWVSHSTSPNLSVLVTKMDRQTPSHLQGFPSH